MTLKMKQSKKTNFKLAVSPQSRKRMWQCISEAQTDHDKMIEQCHFKKEAHYWDIKIDINRQFSTCGLMTTGGPYGSSRWPLGWSLIILVFKYNYLNTFSVVQNKSVYSPYHCLFKNSISQSFWSGYVVSDALCHMEMVCGPEIYKMPWNHIDRPFK